MAVALQGHESYASSFHAYSGCYNDQASGILSRTRDYPPPMSERNTNDTEGRLQLMLGELPPRGVGIVSPNRHVVETAQSRQLMLESVVMILSAAASDSISERPWT